MLPESVFKHTLLHIKWNNMSEIRTEKKSRRKHHTYSSEVPAAANKSSGMQLIKQPSADMMYWQHMEATVYQWKQSNLSATHFVSSV